MRLPEAVKTVKASVHRLTDDELETLESWIGAELQDRDLNGEDEGREARAGRSPAPAPPPSIDGGLQIIKVACGECNGRGQKRTLIDGLPYDCPQCLRSGSWEIVAQVVPRCGECGGPADGRVKAGMKCARCAY